jgi:hypothetical protein
MLIPRRTFLVKAFATPDGYLSIVVPSNLAYPTFSLSRPREKSKVHLESKPLPGLGDGRL